MDLRLTGKVAVVTGASKGIGLAVTRALAEEGVKVVAAARTLTGPLSDLVASKEVHPVQVDLTMPEGPAQPVAEALARYGGLDILVNNVGAVRPRAGGFLSVGDDDWSWALTINFLAAVRTTRAALPHLIGSGAGSIVTVGSVNASLPDPSIIDYCAGKAALTNFCKALSKEVGPQGVGNWSRGSVHNVGFPRSCDGRLVDLRCRVWAGVASPCDLGHRVRCQCAGPLLHRSDGSGPPRRLWPHPHGQVA
jgi:NAD(P)-dependent dehydrogenase (short-subunit alcohol dehydrogenase family)